MVGRKKVRSCSDGGGRGGGGGCLPYEEVGDALRKFCFEPKEALKRAWFKLFSTPKRSQKLQHSESKMHVSR